MDFDAVMSKCNVSITNGGYGGALLSIDKSYRKNIEQLRHKFSKYDLLKLSEKYILELN